MKQYVITTGDYSAFRIVATVQGPDRPAVSTLYKQFCAAYGVPDGKQPRYKQIFQEHAARKRAKEEGYEGWDLGELFVDWLLKNHDFVLYEIKKFHVP